ncbi:MAG: hypothetical protein M3P50_02280, partial [Actinomycetota bacterium]|nr:hypothetical protein [Actinomycetota bacterium]
MAGFAPIATHVLPVVVPASAVLLAVVLLCLLLPARARRALAMVMAQAAYANNSASVFQARFDRY